MLFLNGLFINLSPKRYKPLSPIKIKRILVINGKII